MKFYKSSSATSYMLAGILFGMVFPVCSVAFLVTYGSVDVSGGVLDAVYRTHTANVLLYVIDTAPLFLGAVARFAGVRQDRINGFNQQLRYQVAEKTQSLWSALEEARRAHETVLHMANHDALTGLPNRSLFEQHLNQSIVAAKASAKMLALVFIDLDRFKSINDELGHEVGDAVLIEVSSRLQRYLKEEDCVSRLGGDEFVAILSRLTSREDAQQRVTDLLESISKPLTLAGREISISASLGVSLFPDHGDRADLLMRKADGAMYRVKRSGRGAYLFFDAQHQENENTATRIEIDLPFAIQRNQLRVHYQPQVNLVTREVVAAEALIRWEHPELGLIPPLDFIPIAEQSELIVEIGNWVLKEACRQASAWQKSRHPGFRIAVNVSAQQFHRCDMLETVCQALAQSQLPAYCLELELTESVFLTHSKQVIDTLRKIGEMGVTITVDDFGIGYSCLSYIKHIPMHKLKIDKAFVGEITGASSHARDAAIARAIVAMGKSLGLVVVAEGIETAEQLDFFTAEGCHEAQGYFLGRPKPPSDFLENGAESRSDVTAISV